MIEWLKWVPSERKAYAKLPWPLNVSFECVQSALSIYWSNSQTFATQNEWTRRRNTNANHFIQRYVLYLLSQLPIRMLNDSIIKMLHSGIRFILNICICLRASVSVLNASTAAHTAYTGQLLCISSYSVFITVHLWLSWHFYSFIYYYSCTRMLQVRSTHTLQPCCSHTIISSTWTKQDAK